MKRLFIISVILAFAALPVKAQIAGSAPAGNGAPQKSVVADGKYLDVTDINYINLINTQQKLLKNRKAGLIILASGVGLSTVGTIIFTADRSSVPGAATVLAGSLATATGGIWLIINEFKLIDNRRAINGMTLSAIPGGVALKF